MVKRFVDGIVRDLTAEEQAEYEARNTAWENGSVDRKLAKIKEIRLQKLIETDWWVLRGDITDAQKLYRKNLRDIPQDYTDEASYDLLLARDPDTKELTHSIWSKP
jgi:hypothetical protein